MNYYNNKIMNLVKRCYITNSTINDKNIYPIVQISYHGKTNNSEVFYPYGYFASAPVNTMALLTHVSGQADNLLAMPYMQNERWRGLKSGEVIIGNPSTGSYIKFAENGDIIINVKHDLIINTQNNANITIEKDLIIEAKNNCELKANDLAVIAQTATWTVDNITSTFGSGGNYIFNGSNFTFNGHVILGSGATAAIARVGDTVTVSGVDGIITSGGTNSST